MRDVPVAAAESHLTGFGNEFASEAVAGALPRGRNSPQGAPFDLYPEPISGTAFTAPRHENRRSWMNRRQPSVVCGRYEPFDQSLWTTGAGRNVALPPERFAGIRCHSTGRTWISSTACTRWRPMRHLRRRNFENPTGVILKTALVSC